MYEPNRCPNTAWHNPCHGRANNIFVFMQCKRMLSRIYTIEHKCLESLIALAWSKIIKNKILEAKFSIIIFFSKIINNFNFSTIHSPFRFRTQRSNLLSSTKRECQWLVNKYIGATNTATNRPGSQNDQHDQHHK